MNLILINDIRNRRRSSAISHILNNGKNASLNNDCSLFVRLTHSIKLLTLSWIKPHQTCKSYLHICNFLKTCKSEVLTSVCIT